MPWPPPAGWRRELERRNAQGLPVQPITAAPASPAPRKRKRVRSAPQTQHPGLATGTREHDQPVHLRNFGPIDPANPRPWLD